jgi:hypothetical protein
MVEHEHVSLFGPVSCTCSETEAANLALVTAYRAAKVSGRGPFLAPNYRRHRAGFAHIGELRGEGGMTDESILDRENVLLELSAQGDRVFGIWRVVGTHTGSIYGLAPTGQPVDVLEVGLWRIEDGLIAEAWYFGDELGLLRQLGQYPPG